MASHGHPVPRTLRLGSIGALDAEIDQVEHRGLGR